jgi:hypothetical protein
MLFLKCTSALSSICFKQANYDLGGKVAQNIGPVFLCCLCKDCDLGILHEFNDKKVNILTSSFNFKHNYKVAIQDMLLNLLCEKQKSFEIADSRDDNHED